MKVITGISKRHLHISEDIFKKLFGDVELEVRNPIGQPGQFASKSVVDLKWNDKTIERVRIVGPFRDQTQIEISATDAKELGVTAPRRLSGDLNKSASIILVGPMGEVTIDEGLILAERHIHLTLETGSELNVKTGDLVQVIKEGKPVLEVQARVDEKAANELHIDSDEATEFNLETGEEVEIVKCGE